MNQQILETCLSHTRIIRVERINRSYKMYWKCYEWIEISYIMKDIILNYPTLFSNESKRNNDKSNILLFDGNFNICLSLEWNMLRQLLGHYEFSRISILNSHYPSYFQTHCYRQITIVITERTVGRITGIHLK